jgi:hypothetical protein
MGNHNMKKTIETTIAFAILTIIALPVITLIFPGLEVLIGIARFWHQKS